MIRSFRHKRIEKFFLPGSTAGIQPTHANKLARQLQHLNQAATTQDMNIPGWQWHPLNGALRDHYAVAVNGNYRLTFTFVGQDAILVDDQDHQ